MISPTEAMIIGLLARAGRGAYGSELMHMSDGKLKRGSVYSLLGRLEKAGYVKTIEDPPTEAYALPRTLYKITAHGAAAHREFAEFVGLAMPRGLKGSAA
jgi:DNA-binding PadR family transcriptional regulator